MLGGEHLNTELLHRFWIDLDDWVRKQISSSASGLSGWLKKLASAWQQVGRVFILQKTRTTVLGMS